ncbi:MAG: TraR/DksA C4-type zinc finger protein [Candidatus Pacebacteria bacterium]|jgi:DnaK suppressor protein|nr:TraR/DksA C4-type zinc finger protein [Candidatus Paceibacterota bacterium]MDP7159186.1 TraR/DksA C4-type zinc finger protein [Candidatus Paceibacterota bacterium]MDP7367923.1 TraR/DksA C4-type zinc finger protein [Candidatus Paceibacterota bacterium]MDP7466337.1 TraR/DksA C4-type zinc finger protein [Candidatus Paceibacterota bacterium]MDP7648155.1 TraR/DksA C4-type zinc finger protein [Candidatus Paceibacterota bacterium]|tara:strand:+ start:474 stop:848 length:375 start_codon:yes stop_codon:yes gene_type:complete
MEKIDTQHFKEKLESELNILTEELQKIARINPSNPNDWEPIPAKMDTLETDKNEVADRIEAFEKNTALVKELEIRYNNIKRALKKIDEGKYGTCEDTGEQIPLARLEANPAARTCADVKPKPSN